MEFGFHDQKLDGADHDETQVEDGYKFLHLQ